MTRQTALAKLLNSEGDNYLNLCPSKDINYSLGQIIIIQRALKWYDDEIDDINWREHIFGIVDLYCQIKSSEQSSLIR